MARRKKTSRSKHASDAEQWGIERLKKLLGEQDTEPPQRH
jgi:hypothetical protein